MKPMSCNLCRGETSLTFINFADGEAEPMKIRLKNLPLLICQQGHRQFVRARFAAELLDHLTQQDEPELPAAAEKGLFRKHYLCESCGQELEAKSDHRHTFTINLELENLDPFEVDLNMPVYKCPSCGREQLHSLKEARKLTPKALAKAFLEADIPPPPG